MSEEAKTQEPKNKELKSTSYELFILLLSLVSILNLLIDWLSYAYPVSPSTLDVVAIINGILTVFFLFDFFYRLLTASSKSEYFFKRWGWSDLLACIPSFRIFRLFRIFRAARLLRIFGLRNMINEVINNRAGSALYLAIFGIIVVAELAAVIVLNVEGADPDANINTAADAVWWVFVTLTTVGYGDQYPVSGPGRIAGVFVMFSGVALIGVLASFLSNFFLAPPKKIETEYAPDDPKAKLAEFKSLLAQQQVAHDELVEKISELEGIL
jgi:voltage-gated potassium channel